VVSVRLLPVRRGPSQFQRAADGSMTLAEHLRELRGRLLKASVAVVVGMLVGYLLAMPVYRILEQPYCRTLYAGAEVCPGLQQLDPMTGFLLMLKVALWIGLILAAPVWFYQLWAFVAPGLHRHERRWAYTFVAIAVPLFVAGAVLAYFVVERGLHFLLEAGLEGLDVQLEVSAYINFVTTVMLVFAVAFEFPLVFLMLNFAGVVSARRLLSWWRVMVFAFTAFAAVTTPDPGPFGMMLLAACLSAMYFVAVGVAFLNDWRRAKKDGLSGLADDEISPLDEVPEPVTAGPRVSAGGPLEDPAPVARPGPLERRFDDMT
jgi:sec-independent protein translocase protein TatC